MLFIVRKYLAVLRIGLSNSLEYRANFIMNNIVGLFVGAIVNIYLWKSVYQSTRNLTIGSMNMNDMLAYIALAALCARITQTGRTERNASEDIRSGDLNKYLLKPISHAVYTLVSAMSERISSLVFILIIALAVGIPLAGSAGIHISYTGALLALPILFFAMIINSMISLSLSYLAFWMDEVWTFHVVKDISLWFLSGQIVPMSALPETARTIAAVLPFQYFAYVPAGLISGSISSADAPLYLAGVIAWVGLTALGTSFIWHRGLAKFGAYGG
jgi:ABC-2 type transport system permease protein